VWMPNPGATGVIGGNMGFSCWCSFMMSFSFFLLKYWAVTATLPIRPYRVMVSLSLL